MSDDERPAEPKRTGPSVNESECLCLNHEIVDMLNLLDYDTRFCDKEFPPMALFFFVYAPTDAQKGKQFAYFHQLAEWLLGLCKNPRQEPKKAEFWEKYDAPQKITTVLTRMLKEVGCTKEASAGKLQAGYGDMVCGILHELCGKALQRTNWQWAEPAFDENEPLADLADVDSDAEVGGIDEEVAAALPDDDDEVYGACGTEDAGKQHDEDTWFVANTIDPREWQLELERVTPQLKVTLQSDSNEWRVHVQQTQQYKDHMGQLLPNASQQLQALGQDLSGILQRVKDKESYINRQFEQRGTEYSSRQRELEEVTQLYNSLNESHLQKLEDLRLATEEHDQLKSEMSDRSQTVQDTAPLVKIKDALKKLKNDIRQMDLRIGVVNHTLMQAKLRQKPSGEGGPGKLDWDDD